MKEPGNYWIQVLFQACMQVEEFVEPSDQRRQPQPDAQCSPGMIESGIGLHDYLHYSMELAEPIWLHRGNFVTF